MTAAKHHRPRESFPSGVVLRRVFYRDVVINQRAALRVSLHDWKYNGRSLRLLWLPDEMIVGDAAEALKA